MDNNHDMLTRSKRKKNKINIDDFDELNSDISDDENLELTIQPPPLKKKKLKRLNANNNDDVDEFGNIKGLIDYNYFEPITVEKNQDDKEYNSDDEYTTEEEYDIDEFEDEEINDEELLIGKLLSKYINKKILKDGNINIIEKKEYNELLLNYTPDMAEYFYSLKEEQKEEVYKIEKEITNINKATTPLRFQILKSKINNEIKAIAIRKLETLKNLEPNSTEYYKIKGWVDGLLNIPFGIYKDLPISLKNSKQEITQYLIDSNQTLNKAVFGHKKAKCQILQIVSQWVSNPRSKGSVFSIVGPMGNGKTTLVKEGIAKMINRPFQFISLGGATDSSFFDGHSYTYEGSTPGKIVDILKKSKCMNPVIYFDELDKVSETPKGEEIINLLIHMTDFSQNDHFMDKYYNDIPLDLSKCLFIFSLNDINKVNPILKDRMYMIHTNKLKQEEKIIISQDYLIPKLCQEISINDIIFDEEITKYIIDNYSKEDGVRNLKRAYETILSKLNIIKITETCNINDLELPFKIENFKLPLKINIEIVKKLLDSNKTDEDIPFGMYT
uniref:ATPase family protein n=1 Tax=Mimiviridae sp. ChoanoV1 TaxID=2596887 RepID=A0A5B8IHJ8_9VIRU|nr:ATPase family protein [Mimiviridae sp. ChoanoV1]